MNRDKQNILVVILLIAAVVFGLYFYQKSQNPADDADIHIDITKPRINGRPIFKDVGCKCGDECCGPGCCKCGCDQRTTFQRWETHGVYPGAGAIGSKTLPVKSEHIVPNRPAIDGKGVCVCSSIETAANYLGCKGLRGFTSWSCLMGGEHGPSRIGHLLELWLKASKANADVRVQLLTPGVYLRLLDENLNAGRPVVGCMHGDLPPHGMCAHAIVFYGVKYTAAGKVYRYIDTTLPDERRELSAQRITDLTTPLAWCVVVYGDVQSAGPVVGPHFPIGQYADQRPTKDTDLLRDQQFLGGIKEVVEALRRLLGSAEQELPKWARYAIVEARDTNQKLNYVIMLLIGAIGGQVVVGLINANAVQRLAAK